MLHTFFQLLPVVALALLAYISCWFIVAQIINRNDVADVAWGTGFVVAALASLLYVHHYTATVLLINTLVVIWGLRLSFHIAVRNSKKSEDYRYKAWRDSWGKWFRIRSFFQVFLFQGFLIGIVVTPVILVNSQAPIGLPGLTIVGAAVWLFGFIFESISDAQLQTFMRNPANKGHLMMSGLWRYSRHPNYFGELTQWWGIGLIALSCSYGWVGLIGPAVLSLLIIKISGIPLLEKKYATKPEYETYKQQTSVLIPLPNRPTRS
ncbi:MAG: DUF1295 domain-containing protein [Patescibacteria group bacterium]|nr:DUF1295 domain-containing protein [Patescibacteria group bacterium]